MAPIDEVERMFRQLIDVLSRSDPERLRSPLQISEIYQSILPYRHHRSALGFDTNEDYEMALLRFLAGEGGFASLDPPEIQDALAEEAHAINPNPGAFRDYAAAKVYLNAGAVRTVTEANEAYAPPPESDDEADEFRFDQPAGFETHPDEAIGDQPRFDMVAAVPEPEDGSVAPRVAPDSAPGGTCQFCDRDLPSGRKVLFCPYCGHDLRVVRCSSCATDLEAGWDFCITCGDPLDRD